jgi:hypothetical protein
MTTLRLIPDQSKVPAAALAKEKKAELVTGDPEFKPLEKEIKIHWLK